MLLLSVLFAIVLIIFGYALRSDKGKHTVHARRCNAMTGGQSQAINTLASNE